MTEKKNPTALQHKRQSTQASLLQQFNFAIVDNTYDALVVRTGHSTNGKHCAAHLHMHIYLFCMVHMFAAKKIRENSNGKLKDKAKQSSPY